MKKTMNSIIIEGTHPVFFKTAEEETELLVNGGEKERFYYICCRGIQTLSAQRKLLAGGERWIELQQTVHPEMWNYRLFPNCADAASCRRTTARKKKPRRTFSNGCDIT